MNPAETFTMIVAPVAVLVLGVLLLLGFGVASRRFAKRERQLLDEIEAERERIHSARS